MARSIQIKGLKELEKKLKQTATMEQVKQIVKMNTVEMNAKASRKAPVDTGFLRRSIIFEIADSGMTGKSTVRAHYAPYLEFGTRFMASQPFMVPAWRAQKEIFKKDMDRLVK